MCIKGISQTGGILRLLHRFWGIPISQYIDHRHAGQLMRSPAITDCRRPNKTNAVAAAYIACYFLIDAGYFIGIKKSHAACTQATVLFLGFMVNSLVPAFFIREDKRERFLSFLRSVLDSRWVSLTTLQRLAGKIVSFTWLYPRANCTAMKSSR